MFIKAGAVALALLLASRVLGLVRESAQAAVFGASAMADVAVLMFTLPDWLAGVAVAGALSYVLLPAWAGRPAEAVASSQRLLACWLLAAGGLAALGLAAARMPAVQVLAGGLQPPWTGAAAVGLTWSAVALPAALLAALWATRLQHERDFIGLYGANLAVNSALIGVLAVVQSQASSATVVHALGSGLLLAMAARLLWQWLRMSRFASRVAAPTPATVEWPGVGVWAWAALSAGLPLVLPVAARSVASAQGEGALANFNYAWKLVELPLVLAVQLVASLALPAVAAAVTRGLQDAEARRPVRAAFALAWALACAAAAGLLVGSEPLAQLLFGWGRMGDQDIATIAAWGRTAAWGLLPQALAAVALTVLASQRRMGVAVIAYLLALAAMGIAAVSGMRGGGAVMQVLNAVHAAVGLLLLAALGRPVWGWLPWRAMGTSAMALAVVAAVEALLPGRAVGNAAVLFALLAASVVLAASAAAGGLRMGSRG